jgi:hypothetical protein
MTECSHNTSMEFPRNVVTLSPWLVLWQHWGSPTRSSYSCRLDFNGASPATICSEPMQSFSSNCHAASATASAEDLPAVTVSVSAKSGLWCSPCLVLIQGNASSGSPRRRPRHRPTTVVCASNCGRLAFASERQRSR